MTRSRQLVLVAAVAMAAILALGYFLLISPKRSAIKAAHTATTAQLRTNRTLQQEIDRLNKQAAELPKVQARLAAIDQRIPSEPALPTLIRELTGAAASAGVKLVSLTPSAPAPLTARTTGAARVGAPVSGMQAINVTLVVNGTFPATEEFFRELETLQRSMLVSGFQMAPQGDVTSANPTLQTSISGRVFFVFSAAATASTPRTGSVASRAASARAAVSATPQAGGEG